jgi:hypothetical protein
MQKMNPMTPHVQRIVHNIVAYTNVNSYGMLEDSNGKYIIDKNDWIVKQVESYITDNIKDCQSLIYEYGIDKAISQMQYYIKYTYQIDSKAMCFYILQQMVFEDDEIIDW